MSLMVVVQTIFGLFDLKVQPLPQYTPHLQIFGPIHALGLLKSSIQI